MKEMMILFTRHECGMGGGEGRGEKNINFHLKDSNLRPSDFTIFFKISRQWAMTYSEYIKNHPAYCWDHQYLKFMS